MLKTPTLLLACFLGQADAVETRVDQVFPDHMYSGKFARSTAQKRAVLLLHGLRPQLDAQLVANLAKDWQDWLGLAQSSFAKATLADWQRSGSPLVAELSWHADVFSFAYGQTAPLADIVRGPGLTDAVRRLKDLGYTDIVLLGHSAGGVLARLFVEDNAAAGPTKVIQVCAPNGGSVLAKLKTFAPRGQIAFVNSLSEEFMKQFVQKRKDKRIPPELQFVCVVGKSSDDKFGDCVVTCRCQWPADLQKQMIPAVELAANHFLVMSDDVPIKKLSQLLLSDQPRWTPEQVEAFKRKIGDEEFSRGALFAMIQARAGKAQKSGNAEVLLECAYALAPFAAPAEAAEHPSLAFVKEAARLTLARNSRQDADRFLDKAGALQALLTAETRNKITALACAKDLGEMLSREAIASRGPLTRAGPDFFDPDVATRGGDRDLAETLGKAIVTAVRPTARIGKLASYKVDGKKKTDARMEIEMDFHGGPAKYRGKMTILVAHEKNTVRIVSVVYEDDWLVPWDRTRLAEFQGQFNKK